VTEDHPIVKQLRGIAVRLTRDSDLQKDLMQEMSVHLVRKESDRPGRRPAGISRAVTIAPVII